MITNVISITAIVILLLTVVSLNNEATNFKKENNKLKSMLKDTKYAEIIDLLSDDK